MSLITSTAIEVTASRAVERLATELRVEPTDWDIPAQPEWRKATDAKRCLWVGEWLMSAAASEAERMNGAPTAMWIPGGDAYANQND